jgi:RimJ/RimL family protein N-acetyltransferase
MRVSDARGRTRAAHRVEDALDEVQLDPDDRAPTLVVDELVLRPWHASDVAAVLEACQDPDIGRWVNIPQPFGEAEAAAFVDGAVQMWRDGTGAAFAIEDVSTGRLIGAATRFGPDGHSATFGLWLVPAARGRGVGTRALRRMVDWTFATTDVIRLETFIMTGNDASDRMVERVGFRREGLLRAWDLDRSGRPVDCVAWSLLRSDALPG